LVPFSATKATVDTNMVIDRDEMGKQEMSPRGHPRGPLGHAASQPTRGLHMNAGRSNVSNVPVLIYIRPALPRLVLALERDDEAAVGRRAGWLALAEDGGVHVMEVLERLAIRSVL